MSALGYLNQLYAPHYCVVSQIDGDHLLSQTNCTNNISEGHLLSQTNCMYQRTKP